MAEATTLTETDVGRETCHVVTSSLVEGIKVSDITDVLNWLSVVKS